MWNRPSRGRRRRMITSVTIETTTRASAPRMTPTTIPVIREPLVGAFPSPLLVGTGVPVLELCELVLVDTTLDCDIVGVGTKVLIDVEDGGGGV